MHGPKQGIRGKRSWGLRGLQPPPPLPPIIYNLTPLCTIMVYSCLPTCYHLLDLETWPPIISPSSSSCSVSNEQHAGLERSVCIRQNSRIPSLLAHAQYYTAVFAHEIIDSIDYAGIGNAPSHIQTLLIMPYGVMEKMESTSIPALFQPVQWFYCGKPGQ